jgi:hypothetical protein
MRDQIRLALGYASGAFVALLGVAILVYFEMFGEHDIMKQLVLSLHLETIGAPDIMKWCVLLILACAGVAVAVFWWREACRAWPISTSTLFSKMQHINDPEIVAKWLHDWQAESPTLLTRMTRRHGRNDWRQLAELQHRYDPFPPYWALETAQK